MRILNLIEITHESKDCTSADEDMAMKGGSDPPQFLIAVHVCNETAWKERNRHSPSLFYLLTAGVEVVYFHLITLRHTHHSR
jgi:hypothetical protein